MKNYLLDLIRRLGYTVLVNDNTFTEIHSFHFIVPGMSEMIDFDDDTFMQMCSKMEVGKIIAQKQKLLVVRKYRLYLNI